MKRPYHAPYKGGIFWKILQRGYHNQLKKQIRHRLATEDYTCRLPRVPKPRVRYKLTIQYHPVYCGNWAWGCIRVYK